MNIEFNKLITNDFKIYVSSERLAELQDAANMEKRYLVNKYSSGVIKSFLDKKALEIANTSARYNSLNAYEKVILSNNIVFDNKKFANVLTSGNFDIESLQTFLNLINYLKAKVSNNALSESDSKYLTVATNFTKKLVNHFKKYLGVTDHTVIINKINEVISFEPELLMKKAPKNTR